MYLRYKLSLRDLVEMMAERERQRDLQIGSQFSERIALLRNKAAMLEKAETQEPRDAITPKKRSKIRSLSQLEEALTLRTSASSTEVFGGIWRCCLENLKISNK